MRFLVILLLSITYSFAFAQKEERKNLRSGNKSYEQEDFSDAERSYRKALEVNPQSIKGHYNTGNSLYRQLNPQADEKVSEEDKARMQEAIDQYKSVTSISHDKEEKAMAWHNIGNIFMLTGDYKQSIEAYKNSLLNNPNDNETRYNYVLAKKLLKEQENQNQNQQQQQQNQDQQQNQQQNQNQDQNQSKNEQQSDKMSKENAEQILNAIKQEEQETRNRRKERAPAGNKLEKDW